MIKPKTNLELKIMEEGGKRLSKIKAQLKGMVARGVTPDEIDKKAEELILEAGGKPSFKMVKDYRWTTCININEGVVHGIPTKTPLKEGDLVKVDVGMYYKGFHTDTSFTKALRESDPEIDKFIKAGEEALGRAISQARVGRRVSHISRAMEEVFKKYDVSPIEDLTGHGVGRDLHEKPPIPCLWEGGLEEGELLPAGAVLAIEAIYTQGSPRLTVLADNWTIATKDGKIAGLFEETVAVGKTGPQVLTA